MIIESAKFRAHSCFKSEWAGFDIIKPVNVIIGRNNTGKSHLLDLVSQLCSDNVNQFRWPLSCKGTLNEVDLRQYFNEGTHHGDLEGNHWRDHGRHFVGVEVSWEVNGQKNHCVPVFPSGFEYQSAYGDASTRDRISLVTQLLLHNVKHKLSGSIFRRLLADRDIRSEGAENSLRLSSEGEGATNIIRRYILSSSRRLSRDLIQIELLMALNDIFKTDGSFTEIQAKHHDEQGADTLSNVPNSYEIYLGEKKKGLVALSQSGSGLKTVILVLLNLLVVPKFPDAGNKPKSNYVFAFEELENNLHPALLRRLFQYLEAYAVREKATIFLTTHSSVALDLFGLSKSAQIIHVTHDGESAKAQTVSAHFDHLGVISELGAKPSDLLQSNGIVWVEGPSDCVYLKRWIDLASGGTLREGRDYLCAFYGGSLLARTQFTSPEKAEAELVNLFMVNPNIVVVCDSDRASKGARVKDRVTRIRAEVLKIPNAYIWVTGAREIENYIPGNVLAGALEHASLPNPEQYELFFPRKRHPCASYIENHLNRKTLDKMDLAVLCAPKMEKATMAERFDWEAQITNIVEHILTWNS